jgi:hypothetical protein
LLDGYSDLFGGDLEGVGVFDNFLDSLAECSALAIAALPTVDWFDAVGVEAILEFADELVACVENAAGVGGGGLSGADAELQLVSFALNCCGELVEVFGAMRY